jgi:hypothetical protein
MPRRVCYHKVGGRYVTAKRAARLRRGRRGKHYKYWKGGWGDD